MNRDGYIIVGSKVKRDIGTEIPLIWNTITKEKVIVTQPLIVIGKVTMDEAIKYNDSIGCPPELTITSWDYFYKISTD